MELLQPVTQELSLVPSFLPFTPVRRNSQFCQLLPDYISEYVSNTATFSLSTTFILAVAATLWLIAVAHYLSPSSILAPWCLFIEQHQLVLSWANKKTLLVIIISLLCCSVRYSVLTSTFLLTDLKSVIPSIKWIYFSEKLFLETTIWVLGVSAHCYWSLFS